MAIHTPIRIARFWSKVEVSGPDECWTWKGAVGSNGYGQFKIKSRVTDHAHRIAWEFFAGEELGDRFACHHCDNKRCVNPAHIYAGDRQTNARDAVERGLYVGTKKDQRGASNPRARLSDADVIEIMKLIGEGLSNRAIAARFPVSDAMVSRIRRGRSWTHLGSGNHQPLRTFELSACNDGGPGGGRTHNQTVMSDGVDG